MDNSPEWIVLDKQTRKVVGYEIEKSKTTKLEYITVEFAGGWRIRLYPSKGAPLLLGILSKVRPDLYEAFLSGEDTDFMSLARKMLNENPDLCILIGLKRGEDGSWYRYAVLDRSYMNYGLVNNWKRADEGTEDSNG